MKDDSSDSSYIPGRLPQMMTIRCACGRILSLEVVGGQFQERYDGQCPCGLHWILDEISEIMAGIEAEE